MVAVVLPRHMFFNKKRDTPCSQHSNGQKHLFNWNDYCWTCDNSLLLHVTLPEGIVTASTLEIKSWCVQNVGNMKRLQLVIPKWDPKQKSFKSLIAADTSKVKGTSFSTSSPSSKNWENTMSTMKSPKRAPRVRKKISCTSLSQRQKILPKKPWEFIITSNSSHLQVGPILSLFWKHIHQCIGGRNESKAFLVLLRDAAPRSGFQSPPGWHYMSK